MMIVDKFDTIIFDFDGVIVDSKEIRIRGFKNIFDEFSESLVKSLIDYHNKNGGISRYEKIEWFYKNLLKKNIDKKTLDSKAFQFKEIMLKEMINPNIIFQETLNFIKNIHLKLPCYIISGSDEEELKIICEKLNIKKYFNDIKGSPTKKVDLIAKFVRNNKFKNDRILYIGDSLVDYKSAKNNNIKFFGFNNKDLKKISDYYIDSFEFLT